MVLPDSTAITAAFDFITLVWNANAIVATLFAISAGLGISFYVLRKAKGAVGK